jgi:hypothetical protein
MAELYTNCHAKNERVHASAEIESSRTSLLREAAITTDRMINLGIVFAHTDPTRPTLGGCRAAKPRVWSPKLTANLPAYELSVASTSRVSSLYLFQ